MAWFKTKAYPTNHIWKLKIIKSPGSSVQIDPADEGWKSVGKSQAHNEDVEHGAGKVSQMR